MNFLDMVGVFERTAMVEGKDALRVQVQAAMATNDHDKVSHALRHLIAKHGGRQPDSFEYRENNPFFFTFRFDD